MGLTALLINILSLARVRPGATATRSRDAVHRTREKPLCSQGHRQCWA